MTVVEESHRISDSLISRLLDNVPVGVVVANDSGRIIYANLLLLSIFKYSREQLVGRMNLEDLVPARYRHSSNRLGTFSSHSLQELNGSQLGLRGDGTEFILEFDTGKMQLEGMELIVVSIKDLSKERLSMRGERDRILTSLSHEIRSPMIGVCGSVELLLNYVNRNDAQSEELLTLIQICGFQVVMIVNTILDLSKIEVGNAQLVRSPVNIRTLTAKLLSMLKRTAPEGNWQCRCDDDVPEFVISDYHRITQVLLSLCNNGMKFTDDEACSVTIDISIKNVGHYENGQCKPPDDPEDDRKFISPVPATVLSTYEHPDDLLLVLKVIDTGIGIEDEAMPKLFRLGQQIDGTSTRRFGGSGLGLIIVRRLVELMGGSVAVHSKLGEGSTFRVCFRVGQYEGDRPEKSPPSRAMVSPIPSPAVPFETAPKENHLLLVDDSIISLKIVKRMLRFLGYEDVTIAMNGVEAVTRCEEEKFDMILMDCEMPIMDGFEAATTIRAKDQTIPIIAVTANALIEDPDRCIRSGMNAYLAKPVALSVLRDTLDFYLGTKRPVEG